MYKALSLVVPDAHGKILGGDLHVTNTLPGSFPA